MMLVLVLVSMMVFLLLRLAGDPVMLLVPPDAGVELIERVREDMGFNRPLLVQYFNWFTDLLQGDLGYSYRSNQSVASIIRHRLPVSFWLVSLSLVIGVVLSLFFGILAAMYYNSKIDLMVSFFSTAGMSVPSFFVASMLIYFLAVQLNWFPPSGFINPLDQPIEGLRRLFMPAISLGTYQAAVGMRMLRSCLVEELSKDYIKTARAKGLKERVVFIKHALKNALIPYVTIMGMMLGQALGGAVINEIIFTLPGLGRLLVNNIFARDYPLVQGAVLVICVFFIVVNLIVDLLYAFINPKIKYQ